MKNITKEEVKKLLEQNELENVTYELVQAPYTHVFEASGYYNEDGEKNFNIYVKDKKEGFDYKKSEDHETLNVTQRMMKIKKDGEDLFIMANPYDTSPLDEYKLLNIRHLTKPDYELIETRILSHEREENRVNDILAEKVGGWFTKNYGNNDLIFVKKDSLKKNDDLNNSPSKLSFTEILEFSNKFYEEVTQLRDLHLERFHKMQFNKLSHNAELIRTMKVNFDPKNETGLKLDIKGLIDRKIDKNKSFFEKLGSTFDSNLDNLIKHYHNLYEDMKMNKVLDNILGQDQIPKNPNKKLKLH